MRADSASHLLRHPINFELFLFLYLVCALLLQKINIYKKVGGGRYLEINFFVCACVSLCSKYHVTLFKKCIYSCIYSCHTSRTTYTSHTQHASHSTHITHNTHHTHKQNFHLIDFNLVIFTVVILSRRLAWCTLQELQAHWNPKSSNGSLNFKRWMVVVCTLLVIAWSVVRLVQQTSLFNLLFLFYP